VINENITLGPSILTRTVAGSWNVTLATVYTKMETEYLFPTPRPRSLKILVTLALLMIPESRRFKL